MNAMRNQIDQLRQTAILVRAAQSGDREAFGHLFERYERSVFTVALRRLRNHSEAQELTQDVFVQAMQKLEQLRVPESFGSWLRSITVRMAINRIVRRSPDFATEPETMAATVMSHETPLDTALEVERQVQVQEGLQRLREMDRDTLVAFYVHGKSLIEMSDDFSAPIGTIKRRLHVARKRLAKEVEELVAA